MVDVVIGPEVDDAYVVYCCKCGRKIEPEYEDCECIDKNEQVYLCWDCHNENKERVANDI